MVTWTLPILAGIAVLLITLPQARGSLVDRVGQYLTPPTIREEMLPQPDRISLAGLSWTASELRVRRVVAAVAGALLGLLVAQGDLFVNGTARSAPGLVTTGGLAGVLFFRIWMTQRIDRRRQALMEELPLLADGLALQILAGESVVRSIENLMQNGSGVGVTELQAVLSEYQSGSSLTESLVAAGLTTAHSEAKRLYETLANGHHTGSRLADDLTSLAVDYRARLERELVTEGGKRAIAIYAPILALMVPVTLVFLVYPALAGLRSLAGE